MCDIRVKDIVSDTLLNIVFISRQYCKTISSHKNAKNIIYE